LGLFFRLHFAFPAFQASAQPEAARQPAAKKTAPGAECHA
jgi:hypothetical protein